MSARRRDQHERAAAELRGETRVALGSVKWLAAVAGVAVVGLLASWAIAAHSAGVVESRLTNQAQEVDRLRDQNDRLATDLARTEQKVDALTDLLKQVSADLRRDQPAK